MTDLEGLGLGLERIFGFMLPLGLPNPPLPPDPLPPDPLPPYPPPPLGLPPPEPGFPLPGPLTVLLLGGTNPRPPPRVPVLGLSVPELPPETALLTAAWFAFALLICAVYFLVVAIAALCFLEPAPCAFATAFCLATAF